VCASRDAAEVVEGGAERLLGAARKGTRRVHRVHCMMGEQEDDMASDECRTAGGAQSVLDSSYAWLSA
jgi:hypothetical protein